MIDLDKPCEGLDYSIVPFQTDTSDQAWYVSILRGKWAKALLGFTHVQFDGTVNRLRFNLNAAMVEDDSDTGAYMLDTSDIILQDYAFKVLQDIIRNGIANGSIVFDDKNTDNGKMGRGPRLSFDSSG